MRELGLALGANLGVEIRPFSSFVYRKDEMEEEGEAQLIEKAYVKLTEGTYPEGATKNEKRVIRRKAGTLDVVDGVLHYKRKDGRKVGLAWSYKHSVLIWSMTT